MDENGRHDVTQKTGKQEDTYAAHCRPAGSGSKHCTENPILSQTNGKGRDGRLTRRTVGVSEE